MHAVSRLASCYISKKMNVILTDKHVQKVKFRVEKSGEIRNPWVAARLILVQKLSYTILLASY